MPAPVGTAPTHLPAAPPRNVTAANQPQPSAQEAWLNQAWVNPDTIANAPTPVRTLQAGTSVNERINQLFGRVRLDEQGRAGAQPARVISCVMLPTPPGPAASVVQSKDNAVDCLIKMSQDDAIGKVCTINAADPRHVGGGVALDAFPYSSMPLEETKITLVQGLLASLRGAASAYPLGPTGAGENQIYSRGLQIRYGADVLKAMHEVPQTGAARLAAQREMLLNAPFAAASGSTFRFDTLSIAGVDRRNMPSLDGVSLYATMLRQFANALVTARQEGVKTVLFSVPGSGLYARRCRAPDAQPDTAYLHILGCAVADALMHFGAGLDVVIPGHGETLDHCIASYLQHPTTAHALMGNRYQGRSVAAASSTPSANALTPRSMGSRQYMGEAQNLIRGAAVSLPSALTSLMGDGSKVSLHRVHGIPAPTGGNQPFWFIGRDPADRGRALVSIEVAPGRREVFEMTFSHNALPKLASVVSHARAL